MTNSEFRKLLRTRFGGVMTHGCHTPDGAACALEAVSVAKGMDWTDEPGIIGMPDLRPLNDGPWRDDKTRTKHLIPVVVALWDWETWAEERKQAWVERVVIRTVREVLPLALTEWPEHAEACANATTLGECRQAAEAAWARAMKRRMPAARAAARAATAATAARAEERAAAASEAAARAARAARAADESLIIACRIWAEEAARGDE